ncbi:MAG TPA: DUF2934 domain-containing protein [Aurantimonas coralicida]|uniref:DUF2934 domain-containing protein n=2 Tax=root TaxID=1 RepID=A0A9C9TID9_9HYPH|nr:DUF2934 domain-containing protein [Aurantimonas coralicida]HEU01636.1 DUF2934 domain-containing protein [Aurantimonas coralicida]
MNDDLEAKIRQRAYAIWERENQPEGKHLEHWRCAQTEIEAEQSSAAGQPEQPASVQTEPTEDAAGSAPEGGSRAKKRSN